MSLDANALAGSMLTAARESLGNDWNAAKTYAKPQLERLADILVEIAEMTAAGDITPDEARSLLRIHKNTTETVLLAVKGMGIVAVENAVNAALGVVRDTVNGVVGAEVL